MFVLPLNLVIKNIKNHFSLIIILTSGLSFFLSNILLKEIFSDTDYGYYSILTTVISLVFVYGLLGFEQVVFRYSYQINKSEIATSKQQIYLILGIVMFSTLLSFVLFNKFYSINGYSKILIFLTMLSCAWSLALFTFFRLNKSYVVSQLISNGWKLFLAITTLCYFMFKINEFHLFINVLLIFIILITLLFTLLLFNNVQFKFNEDIDTKVLLKSFVNFFISISTFLLLLFGDRFLIENKLGVVVFGDYFYLTNIIIAPFAIIQNYVGFKRSVFYKQNFTIKAFVNFNKKLIILTIILAVSVVLFVGFLVKTELLSFDFEKYYSTILLLLLLGMMRLYSSGITAAFEAQTNLSTLRYTNVAVVVFIILILTTLIAINFTLNHVITAFIFIWFIKTIVTRQFLLKQMTNQQQM